MHWAAQYIGLKYAAAARGPHEVDCYGLVYLAYLREFGIQLPLYPGISLENPVECSRIMSQALEQEWIETPEFDGAVVAMSERDKVHHVGLWAAADGGKIVHCLNLHNVIAEIPKKLHLRGIRKFQFYRHIKWPT